MSPSCIYALFISSSHATYTFFFFLFFFFDYMMSSIEHIIYIYIISRGQFLKLFSFIFHLSRVARLPNLSNTRDFKCLINLPTLFVLISHKTLHIYMHQLTAHIQTICAISCWGLCRRRYCLRLTTIFHIYICRKQLYWRQE